MSDDDMISKTAALEAVKRETGFDDDHPAIAAIADLPAVTVGVPEATVYRAVLDWIRDDAGAAVKMSMTPVLANALTARILAALDLTPAPDTNQKGGDALARSRSSTHAPHDTSPGVTAGAMPAPDAAAIREAALREAAAEIQRWWEDNSDNREPTPLILALLRKGGA